jgi:hypothetical protein
MDEQQNNSDIRELRHEVAEIRKEQVNTAKDVIAIKTTLEVMQKNDDRNRQSYHIWIPLVISVMVALFAAFSGAWFNARFK